MPAKSGLHKAGITSSRPCFFRKLRCGASGELIIDGLFRVEGVKIHLKIAPFVTLPLGVLEGFVHQFFEWRLVAVDKSGEKAEGRQEQLSLHLLYFGKACFFLADHIVSHQSDAVVIAARPVVEVLFTAQIGAPVRQKGGILPLNPLPNGLSFRFRIVQGNLLLNLLFEGLGIQHVAAAVK